MMVTTTISSLPYTPTNSHHRDNNNDNQQLQQPRHHSDHLTYRKTPEKNQQQGQHGDNDINNGHHHINNNISSDCYDNTNSSLHSSDSSNSSDENDNKMKMANENSISLIQKICQFQIKIHIKGDGLSFSLFVTLSLLCFVCSISLLRINQAMYYYNQTTTYRQRQKQRRPMTAMEILSLEQQQYLRSQQQHLHSIHRGDGWSLLDESAKKSKSEITAGEAAESTTQTTTSSIVHSSEVNSDSNRFVLLQNISSIDIIMNQHIGNVGYRIGQLANAHYLSQQIHHYDLRIDWGYCHRNHQRREDDNNMIPTSPNSSVEIFSYLFGNQSFIDVKELSTPTISRRIENNTYIRITDEVPYHHQLFREQHNADDVQKCYQDNDNSYNILPQKIQHDIQFYHKLRTKFIFQSKVDAFRKMHLNDRDNDIIIGLYITQEQQQHDDDNQWIQNIVGRIRQVISSRVKDMENNKWNDIPMTLFLVSDVSSYHLVSVLQEYISNDNSMSSIKIISYNSNPHRNNNDDAASLSSTEKESVDTTYYYGESVLLPQQHDDDGCLDQWEASVINMMLLSYVHILIAARPSAFSQTLPMQLVLAGDNNNPNQLDDNSNNNNNNNMFCEMNYDADQVHCYDSFMQWYCEGSTVFASSPSSPESNDYIHVPMELPTHRNIHELNEILHIQRRPDQHNDCWTSLSCSDRHDHKDDCHPTCLPPWPFEDRQLTTLTTTTIATI